MPTCAVASCNWHYHKSKALGRPLSYFSFPPDPEIRRLWVESCRRDAPFNVNSYRVCSLHFSKDSYKRDFRHELLNQKPKKRLLPDAVPTLLLGEGKRKKRKSTEVLRRRKPGKKQEPVKDVNAEVPWKKKSRLDSIAILRRSVRKKSDAKTNIDAIPNRPKTENTNTSSLSQQSKAEDLNTNLTQNNNAASSKEIIVNLSAAQNKQVCQNPSVLKTGENLTKTYILLKPKAGNWNGRKKAAPKKIPFTVQNQSTLPQNRAIQTKTCAMLQNNAQNTKQLCLVVGPNGVTKISPYYLLRKETLEEVIERQRREISTLLLEKEALSKKLADQEKTLSYLMMIHQQSKDGRNKPIQCQM